MALQDLGKVNGAKSTTRKRALAVNGRARKAAKGGWGSRKLREGDNFALPRGAQVILRVDGEDVQRLDAPTDGSLLRLDVEPAGKGTRPTSTCGPRPSVRPSNRRASEKAKPKDPAADSPMDDRGPLWYTMTELNQHTRDVMEAVEASGTPAVITRHGKPVATISPLQPTVHEGYGRWLLEQQAES